MTMLECQSREWMWREYMATATYAVGAVISRTLGNEYPIPTWSEIVRPKPKDKRTTEDIVSGLIEKLQKGGGADADADGTV